MGKREIRYAKPENKRGLTVARPDKAGTMWAAPEGKSSFHEELAISEGEMEFDVPLGDDNLLSFDIELADAADRTED